MKVTIIKPKKIWSEKTINEIADQYENCIVGERKYDKSEVYTIDLQEVYHRTSSYSEFLAAIGATDDLNIQESSFIRDYKCWFESSLSC